jgi:glycerol-3-phosphate O-acyltransferase / dihydroxyacetone phosphate acyltransferase
MLSHGFADLRFLDNYEQCVFASRSTSPLHPLTWLVFFFSMKRVVAAWRVLIGVWAPKKWEYSLTALAQYTVTPIPRASAWITKSTKAAGSSMASEPPVSPHPSRPQRPRSGRVMRHILRARAEAVRSLALFISQLETGPAEKRVRASVHLARVYGGVEDSIGPSDTSSTVVALPELVGWRHAHEVVSYLRMHGAKVAALERGIEVDWAAQNSDGDLSSAEDRDSTSPQH